MRKLQSIDSFKVKPSITAVISSIVVFILAIVIFYWLLGLFVDFTAEFTQIGIGGPTPLGLIIRILTVIIIVVYILFKIIGWTIEEYTIRISLLAEDHNADRYEMNLTHEYFWGIGKKVDVYNIYKVIKVEIIKTIVMQALGNGTIKITVIMPIQEEIFMRNIRNADQVVQRVRKVLDVMEHGDTQTQEVSQGAQPPQQQSQNAQPQYSNQPIAAPVAGQVPAPVVVGGTQMGGLNSQQQQYYPPQNNIDPNTQANQQQNYQQGQQQMNQQPQPPVNPNQQDPNQQNLYEGHIPYEEMDRREQFEREFKRSAGNINLGPDPVQPNDEIQPVDYS